QTGGDLDIMAAARQFFDQGALPGHSSLCDVNSDIRVEQMLLERLGVHAQAFSISWRRYLIAGGDLPRSNPKSRPYEPGSMMISETRETFARGSIIKTAVGTLTELNAEHD